MPFSSSFFQTSGGFQSSSEQKQACRRVLRGQGTVARVVQQEALRRSWVSSLSPQRDPDQRAGKRARGQ